MNRYTCPGHQSDFTHILRDGKPLKCEEICERLN